MKPFFIKYPSLLKRLYPNRISQLQEQNTIYLTFDDGPISEITPWVLEQLAHYNAKATFFCIGDNINKNPEIFHQIINEGHSVGNHTFNHLNGWKSKTDVYVNNVLKTEEILVEKRKERNLEPGTLNPKLFRPPYGKIKNFQARKLANCGYIIVMWDVLSGDFDKRISGEQCFGNVTKNASAGSTIVFHDSIKASKNLRFTLPKILEYYAEKGFKFKAL